jgi:hypothetical protein
MKPVPSHHSLPLLQLTNCLHDNANSPQRNPIVLHSKLRSITSVATKSAHDITEFYIVNMNARYYGISVACDTME